MEISNTSQKIIFESDIITTNMLIEVKGLWKSNMSYYVGDKFILSF
jgi:hypothetical protein